MVETHPRVGRYELRRLIATGGMAEVFLAQRVGVAGFSKRFALKRILPHLAQDADFIAMFIDEAKLASQLTHPNLVQVHELGSDDGRYFIAMEYVDGCDLATLRDRLWQRHEVVPPGAVLRIGSELLRGLDYAHGKRDDLGQPLRLVHRDVSPHNVLLSYDGLVKLTDFGVAKAQSRSSKTSAGQLKGKFAYMSPEQASGRPLDQRADLFSVAVGLYELFRGASLYVGETDLEVLDLARKADVVPLDQVVPGFPQGLSDVLARALAPDPTQRYASGAELEAELLRVGRELAEPFTAAELAMLVQRVAPPEAAQQPGDALVPGPALQREKATLAQSTQVSAEHASPAQSTQVGHAAVSPVPVLDPVASASTPLVRRWWPFLVVPLMLTAAWLWIQSPTLPAPSSVPVVAPAPVLAETTTAQEAPPKTTTVPATTEPVAPPQATSKRAAKAKATNAPAQDTPRPPVTPRYGFLTVNSSPWSYVFIDGKQLPKPTPVKELRLSAGQHTVRLFSPADQKEITFKADIKVDETFTKVVVFDEARAP